MQPKRNESINPKKNNNNIIININNNVNRYVELCPSQPPSPTIHIRLYIEIQTHRIASIAIHRSFLFYYHYSGLRSDRFPEEVLASSLPRDTGTTTPRPMLIDLSCMCILDE